MMWLKEHKKQIIWAVVIVFLVAAALTVGIVIGNGKRMTPTSNMDEQTTAEQDAADSTEKASEDTEQKETAGDYTIKIALTSNWETGDGFGGTYSITFTNKGTSDVKSWNAKIEVPEGSTVSEAWGCETDIQGNTLTVTAKEWGAQVAKGASIEVGFNMDTPEKLQPAIKEFSVDGKAQNGGEAQETTEKKEEPVTEARVPKIEEGTPFENHGALQVKGTQLLDKNGNPYQLKGISTHGLAWFPEYVNKEAFQTLRDDWGANVIRLAMYTEESGGYCSGGNTEELKKLVSDGVEYATELGMYVIIDWHVLHDLDPTVHQNEAESFFAEMSAKYAKYDNVIYEICNEPNGGATWEGSVKPYAESIIPIIRKNDKDAIIIVGTPTFSQDVDVVADNPITGQSNIMYALHFYAATHTDALRSKITAALDKGLPIFVSEFSICDASGNGSNDYAQAETWLELIDDNQLSYCAWGLTNKAETASLISSGCSKTSGWSEDELSETGRWIRDQILGNHK